MVRRLDTPGSCVKDLTRVGLSMIHEMATLAGGSFSISE